MTKNNIKATEEYLDKTKYFHHLWQPEEEISDVRKAIKIHKNAVEDKRVAKERLREKLR